MNNKSSNSTSKWNARRLGHSSQNNQVKMNDLTLYNDLAETNPSHNNSLNNQSNIVKDGDFNQFNNLNDGNPRRDMNKKKKNSTSRDLIEKVIEIDEITEDNAVESVKMTSKKKKKKLYLDGQNINNSTNIATNIYGGHNIDISNNNNNDYINDQISICTLEIYENERKVTNFHFRLMNSNDKLEKAYLQERMILLRKDNDILRQRVRTIQWSANDNNLQVVSNKIINKSQNVLLNMKISNCSNYLHFESIPELFIERYGDIPEKIYIRTCYKNLYKLIVKKYQPYSTSLVIGVPGIGKSMFMIYFIYKFLNDKRFNEKRFAIEFSKGKYHTFIPTDNNQIFKYSEEWSHTIDIEKFMIFSDILDNVNPNSRATSQFIFSEPDPRRYIRIMKCKPNFQYILPTWSYDELELLNPDNDSWIKRYCLFGGVPRFIFSKEDPNAILDETIKIIQGRLAENLLKFGLDGLMSDDSYMVYHINPKWSDTLNDWDYEGPVNREFASNSMFMKLTESHNDLIISAAAEKFNNGNY
mmetsp:Transcript_19142/g.17363  ORF Transcript_19142/g.17363 Transcript_19142/m.17363 type:complete len:528 (+) Transcript_19142:25-1608(+)